MRELTRDDLSWAVRTMPRAVKEVLVEYGPEVFLAGGYVRARVTGEVPSDVDLFASSPQAAAVLAGLLAERTGGQVHSTENAFTIGSGRMPLQVIHRWTFSKPEDCLASFDFSIVAAAIWWQPSGEDGEGGEWSSCADDRFYEDLAGKKLAYLKPCRVEEVGGSLLRVLKYYQRGYRITLPSLAGTIARLMSGVDFGKVTGKGQEWEDHLARVITGLLREVDPLIDPTHAAHLPSLDEEEEGKGSDEQ